MVLGILQLFIVNNLGASRAILGAIEGLAELVSYVFRMVSGSLSDKAGKRKIFVLAGYEYLQHVNIFCISNSWCNSCSYFDIICKEIAIKEGCVPSQ
jgi:hypothetical protein